MKQEQKSGLSGKLVWAILIVAAFVLIPFSWMFFGGSMGHHMTAGGMAAMLWSGWLGFALFFALLLILVAFVIRRSSRGSDES